MAMVTARDPQSWLAALGGWQRDLVLSLREAVLTAAPLQERVKWGNLVYVSNGPVLLLRSEETRVLLGFWRGRRLLALAPELKASGKYELANWTLLPGARPNSTVIGQLVAEAVRLNDELGDPTLLR